MQAIDDPSAVFAALTPEANDDASDRAECDALRSEFLQWEAARTRLQARARPYPKNPPGQLHPKQLVFVDGVPGAGKTTHLAWLQEVAGVRAMSMARFAEARDVSQSERRDHQLHLDMVHPTDLEFLDALLREPAPHVAIEKFPRTPVEALALVDLARRHGWRLEVLHLAFPAHPVSASVQRQLERGPRRGRGITAKEARRRARNHFARGASGRWTLQALGVPVHRIDSSAPFDENQARIRHVLGIELGALGWDLPPLQELAQISSDIGISAWVGAGSFYRPFWNGRFGPMQLPNDVDVAVDRPEEVAPLWEALERASPSRRWSVLCPAERLRRTHGLRVQTAAEAKALSTFVHRTGLARWDEQSGAVEVTLPPGTEAALRAGVLRLNARLLDALEPTAREDLLRRKAGSLGRVLDDYPGLTVDPETVAALGGELRNRRPTPIATTWRALKERVMPPQLNGVQRRTSAYFRRAPSGPERAIAEEILRFHRESDRRPSAPTRPARVALPSPIEAIRRARERRKVGLPMSAEEVRWAETDACPPPSGFESWLHWFAQETEDAPFRDWLVDQARKVRPAGGADPWLRELLSSALFEQRIAHRSHAQSAMHQGWPLERHLAQATLELETDALVARLAPWWPERSRRELRLCMRVAMLFHDTGKLVGRSAPRRHAAISARLWALHRPAWFPERLAAAVGWMIETHDLFGAFGRGLTEKRGRPVAEYAAIDLALSTSYFGALDADAVRARLLDSGWPLPLAAAINKALWRADVGAIASMRWLLPVADLVERLLLSGAAAIAARTPALERRRAKSR